MAVTVNPPGESLLPVRVRAVHTYGLTNGDEVKQVMQNKVFRGTVEFLATKEPEKAGFVDIEFDDWNPIPVVLPVKPPVDYAGDFNRRALEFLTTRKAVASINDPNKIRLRWRRYDGNADFYKYIIKVRKASDGEVLFQKDAGGRKTSYNLPKDVYGIPEGEMRIDIAIGYFEKGSGKRTSGPWVKDITAILPAE